MTHLQRPSPQPEERKGPRFSPARPRRAIEEITSQIQRMIADGALQPGDKLPAERILAAQLEVSRNTLREALRMLEITGTLSLRKGARGGSFVAERGEQASGDQRMGPLALTDFSVADLTNAIRAVTIMLLQEALPACTEADLAAMQANVDRAEALKDDPGQRSELMIQFYHLLAEASGNRVLVALADALVGMLRDWVTRIGSVSDDRVIRARRALLECLRRRDSEEALQVVERYLHELHKYWLDGGSQHPSGKHPRRRAPAANG
ncbi:FadR/GntR family transcriptional regulator [Pararoseomonas indoligenes]|uniref:FadR family transcriptional regulator n=1 Tax=Roseomonas indoligenes TaxID=2820811 RepID=A0A940SA19_9PROT|nr:GntR family transcriptional regulator [Pararoseomonas indoligenes]MBP0495883.1 FadR family transcriptional regulator [Pararoseomonas indoligenes]